VTTIIDYQGDEVTELWNKYNEYSQKLAKALGRANNIVGEYTEYLALQYIGGELLKSSNTSADIRAKDRTLYQIKCRKIKNNLTTQLNVIRTWEFDSPSDSRQNFITVALHFLSSAFIFL
jgi:hypothetical protein